MGSNHPRRRRGSARAADGEPFLGEGLAVDTRGPDDPEGLQLSNFYAFEDRETGDIVLPTQRWTPPDTYEYVQHRVAIRAPEAE